MAGDSGEKTEKATPKKRRDQRKEGNVFQSKDVVTVVSLFGSFYILKLLFPKIYETVQPFYLTSFILLLLLLTRPQGCSPSL